MSNRAKSPATAAGTPRFQPRDRVRSLLPSDIQKAWRDAAAVLPPAIGASFQFLDPVFHPAESAELEKWVDEVVGEIADKQKNFKSGIQSGEGSFRDFRDCDDSAFSLKSAASAYRESKLSAPLCVGVVACRTRQGRDHVLNWFVSANIQIPGKYPVVDYKVWFADISALVEAAVQGWDRKSTPPAGPDPKLLKLLASADEAARYFKDPYLILV